MKKERKRHTLLRFFIKLFVITGILLLIVLFLFLYFRLEKVTISGCEYYTEETIKETLMTGTRKNNTLFLYLYYKNNTPSIPMIQKIDVKMIGRNELQINIYEKTIVACIEYMSTYMYFDKDGIIVESLPEKIENVPLITGIRCGDMTLHEPFNVENKEIFDTILELSKLIKHYELKVDRLYFSYDEKLTLYSGNIKVLLGKKDRYDEQIAELSHILPEAEKDGQKGVLNMEDYTKGQDRFYLKTE